jgi:hypothetical protein
LCANNGAARPQQSSDDGMSVCVSLICVWLERVFVQLVEFGFLKGDGCVPAIVKFDAELFFKRTAVSDERGDQVVRLGL